MKRSFNKPLVPFLLVGIGLFDSYSQQTPRLINCIRNGRIPFGYVFYENPTKCVNSQFLHGRHILLVKSEEAQL